MNWQNWLPSEIINDVAGPTAKTLGESLGGIAKTVFYPLLVWNIVISQNIEDFQDAVKNHVETIPDDERDATRLPLVAKIFDDSKYQLDSAEMRELFATLIASTLDRRYNQKMTPRISAVLKEMSGGDAVLLLKLKEEAEKGAVYQFSVGQYFVTGPFGVWKDRSPQIVFEDGSILEDELAMNNLEALGIIKVDLNHSLSGPRFANNFKVMETPEKLEKVKGNTDSSGVRRGYLEITEFGQLLMLALSDHISREQR